MRLPPAVRLLPALVLAASASAQPASNVEVDDIVVTIENGVCYAETDVVNEFDEFHKLIVRPGAAVAVRNASDQPIEVAVFPSASGVDGVTSPDVVRLGAGARAEIVAYETSETTEHPVSIKCLATSLPQGSEVWVEATTVVRIGEGAWLLGEPFVLMVTRISGIREGPPDTGGMRPKPAGDD